MKLASISCVNRASFIRYESINSFFCTHCKHRVPDTKITWQDRSMNYADEIICECGQYFKECDQNGNRIGSIAFGSKDAMELASETVFRNTNDHKDEIVLSKIYESFFPVKSKKGIWLIKRRKQYERAILNLKTGQTYVNSKKQPHPINVTYVTNVWQLRSENDVIKKAIVDELFKVKGVNKLLGLTTAGIDDIYPYITLMNRMPNMFIRRNAILNIDTIRNNYEQIYAIDKSILKKLPKDIQDEKEFIKCISETFKIKNNVMLNALQLNISLIPECIVLTDMKITNDKLLTSIFNKLKKGDYHLISSIAENTFDNCSKSRFKAYMTALKKEIPDDNTRYDHIVKLIKSSSIHGGPGYLLGDIINNWQDHGRSKNILLNDISAIDVALEIDEELPFR